MRRLEFIIAMAIILLVPAICNVVFLVIKLNQTGVLEQIGNLYTK